MVEVANEFDEAALPSTMTGACDRGDEATVTAWLDGGGDVNAANSYGATLLRLAAWNGHDSIVRLLIGRGASLDLQNKGGHTALMLAARNGYAPVVQALLAAGARTDLVAAKTWIEKERGWEGQTALRLAEQYGKLGETPHVECARLLRQPPPSDGFDNGGLDDAALLAMDF